MNYLFRFPSIDERTWRLIRPLVVVLGIPILFIVGCEAIAEGNGGAVSVILDRLYSAGYL